MHTNHTLFIAVQTIIDNNMLIIRNKRVLLDTDVAMLYEVDVDYLRKQVEKEKARLPEDFMFQLSVAEYEIRSKDANVKQLPYAFTEGGIMILGGVLNTKKAIKIHIQVIEHFVQLYKDAMQINELFNKLDLNTEEETKELFTILQQLLK